MFPLPVSWRYQTQTFCPHSVIVCFEWICEQTAIISLYSINWLVCITETVSVYCAVRAGSLTTIQVYLGLPWLKPILRNSSCYKRRSTTYNVPKIDNQFILSYTGDINSKNECGAACWMVPTLASASSNQQLHCGNCSSVSMFVINLNRWHRHEYRNLDVT